MKNTYIIILVIVFSLLAPTYSPAEADWAVDILPGALLANFSADEFHVIHDNQKEEVSMLSSIPSIAAGCSIERVSGYIDLKAGAGMVLNAKFNSFMYFASAGIYKEIRPSIMMGPHITVSQFSAPSWWGDADIEFEDTVGYLIGMHLIAGDRISYLLSVDYLSAVFDVDPTSPVKANKEELDISGIAVQFGVRAQF